jgi:hypothetical protein
MPQLRGIECTELQRMINTRAILLFENDKKNYYLRVQDWWLQAKDLEGPWTYANKLPKDMKKAEEFIASQTQSQNLEGEPQTQQPSLKQAGKKAEVPVIYVVYAPTELIETKGEPQYKPIPTTGLEYRACCLPLARPSRDDRRCHREFVILTPRRPDGPPQLEEVGIEVLDA